MLVPTPIPWHSHVRKVYYWDGIAEGTHPGPGEESSSLLDHDMPTQRTKWPFLAYSPQSMVNMQP